MDKIKRMKIIIGVLILACIGLTIGVIFLAVKALTISKIQGPKMSGVASVTSDRHGAPGQASKKNFTSVPGVISDDDLRKFSEELLKSDENNMAKFVTVNVDVNPDEGESLLDVDKEALDCATIKALTELFVTFKAPVNVADNLGDDYLSKKQDFLELIMDSEIMKITELWMINQGLFEDSNMTLHDIVDHIWFMPYAGSHSSSGFNDSTGFEHTFVGMKNDDKVLGLHNWVRFYELEQAGNVTFVEFFNQTIFDGDLENKGSILKISFHWEDASKYSGTMFVGTSPELEMALYTVCFMARPNGKCPVQMNGKQFTITTMDHNRLRVIAVANPNI
ncbi:unnamed protein product, partial [Meganyctiphanes norvegica]